MSLEIQLPLSPSLRSGLAATRHLPAGGRPTRSDGLSSQPKLLTLPIHSGFYNWDDRITPNKLS
jgi:hypothetical protein